MSGPMVTIEQGTLQGTIRTDYDGNVFYSFQGIPYAKPPIGDLRFKAPEPPEPWEGVWDATKERDPCYSQHYSTLEMIGSEDCLYLNVFTPQISKASGSDGLKPVMVSFHSGRFIRGSGTIEFYGPEYLMTQDVVLVTFNYRVGCLGFLRLEDPALDVPGNAAMKDQVMVLRWIQKNISAFMGDASNVTLFGISAGAASVHLMMLSPMATGLFHKAIPQSCSGLHYWNNGSEFPAPKLAAQLGFEYTSDRDFLNRLRETPVEKIFQAQKKIRDVGSTHNYQDYPMDLVRPFGPVVEKPSDNPSFLCDKPINIIRSGNYNHVPLMTGYHYKDAMGEMLYRHRSEKEVVPNFDFIVPCDLELKKGTPEWNKLVKHLKDFYFGKEDDPKKVFDGYVDMFSDSSYIRRVHSTVRNHLINSRYPIFFYVFSFDGKANFHKRFKNLTIPGSIHSDEMGYLFTNMAAAYIVPGSPEVKMMRRMTKLWANFARYGDPTPEKDELLNVEWKPVTNKELNYLDIGEELTMKINPEKERMYFWDEILQSHPSTFYL